MIKQRYNKMIRLQLAISSKVADESLSFCKRKVPIHVPGLERYVFQKGKRYYSTLPSQVEGPATQFQVIYVPCQFKISLAIWTPVALKIKQ